MNNKLNNKSFGLPLTGVCLIGMAAANTGVLIVNKLIPMLNGSFQAEMLPGVGGGVLNGVMAVFGVTLAVFALSYLLMALLGVNALRVAKNPDGVKARTGLAKFLLFTGAVSILSGFASLADAVTVADKLLLFIPAVAQLVLVGGYLYEVKASSRVNAPACA